MSKRIAADVLWDTRSHFIYVPDHIIHPDYFDHWQSHADEVEQGVVFKDDCDGYSLTNADLLIRKAEITKADIRIIYCKTETNTGHLVTSWQHWILDNRQRGLIYWQDLPYKWIKSMRMSERGIWREMA